MARRVRSTGRGEVTTEAFPEPYIGPLSPDRGEPRVVALGLNPGEADISFQGRGGVFEQEIVDQGGYAAWASTAPYLREPWRSAHRHNRYSADLRTFAQRWTLDASVRSEDVLVFELYPWHSDKVTAEIHVDPQVIEKFIWEPLAEIDTDTVFAFGKDWAAVALDLGLAETRAAVRFAVPSRRLRTFELRSGQRLAIVWQPGYSGPPGENDVEALREALRASRRPDDSTAVLLAGKNEQSYEVRKRQSAARRPSPLVVPQSAPSSTREKTRYAHLHAFAELVDAGLGQKGFGRVGVPKSLRFMWARWPDGLWFREHTQQGDLHFNITDDELSVRVHIDTFHGDRPRNEAALDIIQEHVQHDLLARLPAFEDIDWRAARGGNNQVCAVKTVGGVRRGDPHKDAEWAVAAASAWLEALKRHPVGDLHELVERRFNQRR